MGTQQPNYEKSVGKGYLFEKAILAGTLESGGTLGVPPQARVPAGLPTLSP